MVATEQQIAYLAGLIDGDGHIALYRRKDLKATRGYTFTPVMGVTAKDKWFLEYLAQEFDAKVNITSVKSGFKESSVTSQIRWSSNRIRELLPRLIPYLILKKQEAILLEEALKLTENHRKRDTSNDVRLEEIVMNIKKIKKERVKV